MKSKISPTSPKINEKHRAEIDKLYQHDLKTIERPGKTRSFNSLWFLLLVIFFGFIAGILGLIVLMSYGSEIPYIGKLDLFSYPAQTSLIISGTDKSKVLTTDEVGKIISEMTPSVVSIYEKKDTSFDLNSIYLAEESRGSGFILTDDGYIVTTRSVASSNDSLVVITNDGVMYDVETIVPDLASDFSFLKISGINLTTFSIADWENIKYTEDILLLEGYSPGSEPAVFRSSIISASFREMVSIDNLIDSSESDSRRIWLGNGIPDFVDQSIAFTIDKQALGVMVNSNGRHLVIPFTFIKPVIDDVLSAVSLSRPYLGVHYINLAYAVGITKALSQSLTKGALIYSDDEESRPSVRTNSPAQKAGLKKGDIITDLNNIELNANSDLAHLILEHQVGETITLTVFRDGVKLDIKVNLEKLE